MHIISAQIPGTPTHRQYSHTPLDRFNKCIPSHSVS
jgi:hypothetical protein